MDYQPLFIFIGWINLSVYYNHINEEEYAFCLNTSKIRQTHFCL